MEPVIQTKILSGLAFGQIEAHETSQRFGRWDKKRNIGDQLLLIHRDCSRALEIEAIGDGPSDKIKGFTRLEETLADLHIQLFDISGGREMKVASAVVAKMLYNEQMSKLVKHDY